MLVFLTLLTAFHKVVQQRNELRQKLVRFQNKIKENTAREQDLLTNRKLFQHSPTHANTLPLLHNYFNASIYTMPFP